MYKTQFRRDETRDAVHASLRCFVFHYLALGWGIFFGKMRLKSVSAPLLVFTCSPVLCFIAFAAFSKARDFQSGFAVGIVIRRRSFSGKTRFVFCHVGLLLFSRFVSRHILGQRNFAEIHFLLWSFVFQHLALFFGGSWVAFGVVLGCLWARPVYSGRGALFC